MKEVMIDLETLGTGPNAVVLSIGAALFDISGGHTLLDTFHEHLEIQPQLDLGRQIDGSTVLWWLEQNEPARLGIIKANRRPPDAVLGSFMSWCARVAGPDATYWGNGSSFDITILGSLIENSGITPPWGYNKINDLRTFKRFVAGGEKIVPYGTPHNAVDDAIGQALYVMKHYKK